MIEIGGFQRVSLIDYPGKIASIIFTVGCNFRCPFCQNKDLVLRNYKSLRLYSYEEIFEKLEEAKGFIDGVEITGGEPTIWGNELIALMEKLKKYGLIKLDSNGSNPRILKEIIEKKLVDYIAMDIKTSLNVKKYAKAIGLSEDSTKEILKNVLESIELIKNSKVEHEFRTTLVPSIVEKEDVVEIANYIKGENYFLQRFEPRNTLNKDFENIKPYKKEFFEEVCNEIKGIVKCNLRVD
ncbi:MAG: anaerobic ribonucleoside-triphosphate reductase activating protein [Candidatus Micrarchaeia archaeon]